MSKPLTVDLFVEDRAHEEFLKAMMSRLASEHDKPIEVRVRAARGGHGRALAELRAYQESVTAGIGRLTLPDLLVVAIDTNCMKFTEARSQIGKEIHEPFSNRTALACPDPHVERWYVADPPSFEQVVGIRPKLAPNGFSASFDKGWDDTLLQPQPLKSPAKKAYSSLP